MVYKVNERVMAKWPGSNLWFEAVVVDYNDIEYQVRFNDAAQSEYVLRHREVRKFENFKRSRSRSRGRSNSRGRSVGRRAKEEKEREVVSTKKEKVVTKVVSSKKEKVVTKVVSSKKEKVTKVESVSNAKEEPIVEVEKEALKVVTDSLAPRTSTPMRQSPRIAALQGNAFDGQVNNIDATKEKSTDVTGTEVPPTAPGICTRIMGGLSCIGSCIVSGVLMLIPSLATIQALLGIVMMLALPLVLNRMCTKTKCTVMEVPYIPTKLKHNYDLTAVSIVGVLMLEVLLLGLIPLGRKVTLPNGAVMRCNGFISVLVSLILIPALMYFEYNVLVVYSLFQHLYATFAVLTVVLALLLYIRAGYVSDDLKNPSGNSGRFFPDFFNGRELNPTFGPVDLKMYLVRVMSVMMLLINVVVIIQDLDANKGVYSPTLLMTCIFQIFLSVDLIWFEETLFTTYMYKKEGCGFMFVSIVSATPFSGAVFARMVLNHRTELEWYCLTMIAALNLVGYTIFRGSLSQKHAFRTNPSDPALAHLESLPTSAGTRLLVSGWWGVVRHPNYLGAIVGGISWALITGFKFALPWIIVVLDLLYFIARMRAVERDCKKKYGTAWESYNARVKYRLIPKVF